MRPRTSLNDAVAKEIRVLLLRRDMRQTELAANLGVNEMWLSRRLRGAQPLDLNDLQRIADALGVEVADLFPRNDARAEPVRAGGHSMGPNARRTEKTRPNGHPKRTGPHRDTRRPARNQAAIQALSAHADDSPARRGR